jgi:hypothetical protein
MIEEPKQTQKYVDLFKNCRGNASSFTIAPIAQNNQYSTIGSKPFLLLTSDSCKLILDNDNNVVVLDNQNNIFAKDGYIFVSLSSNQLGIIRPNSMGIELVYVPIELGNLDNSELVDNKLIVYQKNDCSIKNYQCKYSAYQYDLDEKKYFTGYTPLKKLTDQMEWDSKLAWSVINQKYYFIKAYGDSCGSYKSVFEFDIATSNKTNGFRMDLLCGDNKLYSVDSSNKSLELLYENQKDSSGESINCTGEKKIVSTADCDKEMEGAFDLFYSKFPKDISKVIDYKNPEKRILEPSEMIKECGNYKIYKETINSLAFKDSKTRSISSFGDNVQCIS